MSKLQKILLAIFIVTMILLVIIFWGSIFSSVLALAMIVSTLVYLYHRFLFGRDESYFMEEDNGE